MIAMFWVWLGLPVPIHQAPLKPGQKLYCVSYAPFHGSQTPLDLSTHISADQIDHDLGQLAQLTDCVRTYSTDFGLDQIAGIAAKHGLKVIQGLWLSGKSDYNRSQIETAVALAKRYVGTIRAVVVGNETLLRGEMSGDTLAGIMREVKSRVSVPVTYGDVWEFWLRNPQVASAADFITIHILPYWEDFPIAANEAAAHVDAIRLKVAAAFPGKEILIGEVGWPSAGRMREGALPSPYNQARAIQDVLALAARENFRVNLIEAYDQPWKRALEGTTGGHWGLISDARRQFKFVWGEPVSNHPQWLGEGIAGVAFAVIIFALTFLAGRKAPPLLWGAVTTNAIVGGGLIGWTIANVPLQSLGAGGWIRSCALAAVAMLNPLAVSLAIMRGVALPRFSKLLGPAAQRTHDPLTLIVGTLLIATTLLAVLTALGLAFDPRYKDFPFAPLTAAAVPFLLHTLIMPRPPGERGTSEILAALLLALAVPYIVLDESFANWQSLWLCGALAAIAVTLIQARGARS